MLSKRLQNVIKFSIAFSFFTTFLFGIFHFGTMQHGNDGATSCPFLPGHTSFCNMSPLEDMQAWQNMLTALPIKAATLLFSLLLTLLSFLGLRLFQRYVLQKQSQQIHTTYPRNVFIPNHLTEAFSRGILNPKPF